MEYNDQADNIFSIKSGTKCSYLGRESMFWVQKVCGLFLSRAMLKKSDMKLVALLLLIPLIQFLLKIVLRTKSFVFSLIKNDLETNIGIITAIQNFRNVFVVKMGNLIASWTCVMKSRATTANTQFC